MLKLKTQFIPRILNFVNPKICIYDLDGTIIDSSHRTKYMENGELDLANWKANNTKENIFKDGSEYFGPYANVKHMHKVLELVKKLYPIRTCNYKLSKENIEKSINDILNNKKPVQNNLGFQSTFSSPLKEAREKFETEYLKTQLKRNHGNISKTADFIGMERSALHRKLKILGIKGIN